MQLQPHLVLLFLAFLLTTTACQQTTAANEQDSTTATTLTYTPPKLLDRHTDLQQGTEWDQVQRFYVAQRDALVNQDKPAEAALKLAQLYINEARITGEHGHYYPAALEVIEQGLQQVAAEDTDTRFLLLSTQASVELSQHDFSQALKTAETAVQLNPYNARIYGALVDANVELGRYETAVAMADKMVNIRPDLRSYARVAYLREIHGDVPGAIDALQMAIKAGFPGQEATSWARITLAEFYETYGEPEKAREQYQMALAERPDYPFAIAGLAGLAQAEGKLDEAEAEYLRAAAIIPEVGFYTSLAEIYKARGEEEKLTQIKTDIQAMLQDDVDSGHRMDMEYADLYLNLYDDPTKALTYVQGEYERRPENIDVNRMLAKIYQALGDAQKVELHLAKAARTDSKHPDLLAMAK